MIMGMCFQNTGKTVFLCVAIAFLAALYGSCDAIDTILPSAGNYKISMSVRRPSSQLNEIPIDECSFVTSLDDIYLHFEVSVSNDQDVTGLTVFFRNANQQNVGQRVAYSLDGDLPPNDADLVIINNLDTIPSFRIPDNLPAGMYTLVSHVMSGGNVLQRTERSFYYLRDIKFSYEGINIYLPGISNNSQLIPKGALVMAETGLTFSKELDPYIVWYEGRRKISEGYFSDGAGNLFWRAPEQSGFFSLRAEVFPVSFSSRLAGFNNELSLLVSPSFKITDMYLIAGNIPQLTHWYTFEGNLNNLKTQASAEQVFTHTVDSKKWMGANGTYGIVTGNNNVVDLANVSIPENRINNWQILMRFMKLNNGGIFSAVFDPLRNIFMHLFMEGDDLVLTLSSHSETVSQIISLPRADSPEVPHENELKPFFITASVGFSITQNASAAQLPVLTAVVNSVGDFYGIEPAAVSITLDAEIDKEFRILLGSVPENKLSYGDPQTGAETVSTALWDEFALYYMATPENLLIEIKTPLNNAAHVVLAADGL